MHTRQPAALLIALLTGALFAPAFAVAADAPARKSGLWEINIENTGTGQKSPGPMTMQICVDQSKDDMTAAPKDNQGKGAQDMRKKCSKMDAKRIENKTVIDSVCQFNQHTATGHTVISGNMASNYRMESTTRFDPPMHGMQTASSTMTGKWLGACKPGQQHGSMVMSGMPGMGAGASGFKMDPEMMKRMQQMQQRQ